MISVWVPSCSILLFNSVRCYFFWKGLNPDDPIILDSEPSQHLEQCPGTVRPHVVVGFVFVWIWQDVWQLTTTWNFHLEGTMESISLTWGIVTCVLGKEWRRDSNPVPSDSKSHVLSIGLLLLNPRRAAFRFAKSCVIHWSTVIESAAGCGNCWYGILTN